MTEYQLNRDIHVMPTPLGVYYAVSNSQSEPARKLILGLMSNTSSQPVSVGMLSQYSGEADPLALLCRMENLRWVEGYAGQQELTKTNIESEVPQLLAQLSGDEKALLTDDQGFHLANSGFAHELAEDIAIFAAEVASIQRKHIDLIKGNLRLSTPAMSVVDNSGDSELGFWPFYIGEKQFILVISGMPLFDKPAYMHLVWSLCHRYNN